GKSRESTQSAGLFTALSVWTVARKRQLAAWRGGFMQQRRNNAPIGNRAFKPGFFYRDSVADSTLECCVMARVSWS
ncbi:hypothetical protein, partial [Ralstonia pseudosolanacearum]|uniref:hypothetical protein n=1 Tax=Ralstonia pseudosolanacearum TaxID=1310165 RepID=UPI001E316722